MSSRCRETPERNSKLIKFSPLCYKNFKGHEEIVFAF